MTPRRPSWWTGCCAPGTTSTTRARGPAASAGSAWTSRRGTSSGARARRSACWSSTTGRRVTLDGDYVLGREPTFDSDVIDGRARPLRINDPDGTVSRLHLRISLIGWQVEVSDLGSANGSVLQSSGAERPLAPFEPTIIEPGTRIGIGHRSMQYLAYQGVLP